MKVIDKLVDIANNGTSEIIQYFRYYNRNANQFDSCMLSLDNLIYKLNNGTLDINDEIKVIDEDTPKEDKEIELYVNGEKVDISDIYEPLKQGEFFYKENGKWYIHKLKNVSFAIEEDKKIEKLKISSRSFISNQKVIINKLNEIIDMLNGEDNE